VSECTFCEIARGAGPARVVHEDDLVMAFLDARPVFPGHTLLIPKAHHATLADLPDSLLAPLMGAARLLSRAVPEAMAAQGSFVAMNNEVSQSVPHLHVHVVPRSKGDGLRGFFWPRHKYADDEEADRAQAAIRQALQRLGGKSQRGA
jgi:histidine triad (HIT) family protein